MAWHDGYQVWLSEAQALENAQLVFNFCARKGSDWTKVSAAAMCGNLYHESSINPNMYEYGHSWAENRGYGIVQWTPRSKYWDWAIAQSLNPREGDTQLARLEYEAQNKIQWIPNRLKYAYGVGNSYAGTFEDFRKNKDNLSVNDATEAFMWDYEGPLYSAGVSSLADRQAFANKCFTTLKFNKDNPTPDPTPEPPDPDRHLIKDPVEVVKRLLNALFDNKLYIYNESYNKANSHLNIKRLFGNIYKINTRFDISKLTIESINELFGVQPDPNPDPNPDPPDPVKGYYWPYDTNQLTITSPMGPRWGAFHQGIDMVSERNQVGDIIYAIHSGTVVVSTESYPGWEVAGSMIVIKNDEDGLYITYQEFAKNSRKVKVGDKVKGGQAIAQMGYSGAGTGVHLHIGASDTLLPPISGAGIAHWKAIYDLIGLPNAAGAYVRPNKIHKSGA